MIGMEVISLPFPDYFVMVTRRLPFEYLLSVKETRLDLSYEFHKLFDFEKGLGRK